MTTPQRYGLMAEFASADRVVAAVRAARAAGYRRIEVYSPFPIEELPALLAFEPRAVAPATLAGGVLGGLLAIALQWGSAAWDYPLDIGGRPPDSWPMFVPVSFELITLGAALAAVIALFAGCRLPALRHPVFDAPDFDLASRDRFFLCLRADDPAFDAERTAAWLAVLEPLRQMDVPA